MDLTYNASLVSLSVGVAILASFTSLQLAGRVADSSGNAGRAWLLLGAVSMGFGIWSMHFIGMLAVSLPISLRYDAVATLMSLAIAILTSGFAIHIASGSRLGRIRRSIGSLVMGSGIVAMHYTGMWAIPIIPPVSYDMSVVALSAVIAVAASWVALSLTFNLRATSTRGVQMARLKASAVMGAAIAGMHYTGMAAAHFAAGAFCRGGPALDQRWIALTVASASIPLLISTSFTAIFDAHMASRTRRDAEHLAKVNARLEHQSRHDALTDLPNRTLFIDRLIREIEQCRRTHGLLAVMLVDLDRFKNVNDALGHGVGDAILKEVAARLTRAIGHAGMAARLGGDQFLVMVHVAELSDIARIAAEIVQSISRTYAIDAVELYLAASAGITTYPFDDSAPEVLISHADEAMYETKHDGGRGYRFFVPGTTVFTFDRLQLDRDLRHAVELHQLVLHYQPVVDVATGCVRGLEALVRWQHPQRGFISPGEFIPIAEASDAIIEIGRWVMQEACRQARAWTLEGLGDIFIAVNISARQFRQADLLAMIQRAADQNGLPPQRLVIELTESVVMSDADRSTRLLDELHRAGFQIAVDDFGTGYSSMAYLKRLPVGKLKIDRSFINDLGSSIKNDSIVDAVIALAHGLGMEVVAEGVENRAQLETLQAFGCDQFQGYFCSKPRSAGELSEWLRAEAERPRESGPMRVLVATGG